MMLTGPMGLYPGGVMKVLGDGEATQMPPTRNPVCGVAGPWSLIQQRFPIATGSLI